MRGFQKSDSEFLLTGLSNKPLNYFWAGFLIYTVGYIAYTTDHFNLKLCQLVQAIGLIIIIPACIILVSFKFKSKYLSFIYTIYCLWLLSIIFRGFIFDYDFLKKMLFDADYGMLLYFTPIVLAFPKNILTYQKLFDIIIIFGFIFIFFDLISVKDLLDRSKETQDTIEYFSKNLSLPCGFILLTYLYHSKRRLLIAWGVMIVTLLFSIYKARRGLSSICILIIVSWYLFYYFKMHKKIITLYFTILLVLGSFFFINRFYKTNKNGLFSLILNRGEEDTRTGVELYFYSDFKPTDWLIGRGINGKYFCPDIDEDQPTNYRFLIETGYLQIILKGGIIRLALYLLITIPAIILGLFYSKNLLSKASSIWIFIALFSLYPATVNTFNLNFMLVWFCIGICYTKEIRHLSDEKLTELIKFTPRQ